MSSNSRLTNVEAIRCFAIISLVVWHSICVYVGWQSFLPDITQAVGDSLITKIYKYATTLLIMPDANMPLFVIMAAYVYSHLWNKGAYRDTKDFYKKKIHRLVIPYFVIGTLVVFTIADWNPLSILLGRAHHLWFCAMLFWCFSLIRLYQILPPYRIILALVCLIIQVFPLPFDILGIAKGLSYFPYFLFGYYLYDYLPRYRTIKWNKMLSICFWIASIGLYFLIGRVEPVCYAFCFMIFDVVPDKIHIPEWVSKISTYSFGIYVFHEWFLWNAAHIQALHPFIIAHQIMYPVLTFSIVFVISVYLTKYSLKTKVGRYLLA